MWCHHQGGSSLQNWALWLEFTYCRAASLLCSSADCIILFFIRLISTKTCHRSQTRRIRRLSAGPWNTVMSVTAASCVSEWLDVIWSWIYLSYPIIHTIWFSVFQFALLFPLQWDICLPAMERQVTQMIPETQSNSLVNTIIICDQLHPFTHIIYTLAEQLSVAISGSVCSLSWGSRFWATATNGTTIYKTIVYIYIYI